MRSKDEAALVDAFVAALGDEGDEGDPESRCTRIKAVVAAGVAQALHPSTPPADESHSDDPGDDPGDDEGDDEGVGDHAADPTPLGTIGRDKVDKGWTGAVSSMCVAIRNFW